MTWRQFLQHLEITAVPQTESGSSIFCTIQTKKRTIVRFVKRKIEMNVQFVKQGPLSLEEGVMSLLPKTGSVEVQRDTPRREHKTHTHPTDETLLIVGGDITFFAQGQKIHCASGDRILLPANTPHSSIAGEGGCLYIIALRFVTPDA
jgi:cupin superfamily acireductone dioxygenase involved in methionine salvage